MSRTILKVFSLAASLLGLIDDATAGVTQSPPMPDAVVDLRTNEGAAIVQGEWRFAEARIVEVDHRAPGSDLKPSGQPIRATDVVPHAGPADFDDSSWPVIGAETLEQRRGTGRLSFAWYRINVTVPETIGAFNTAGSAVYFEIVVDDYAEVWVNGRLPVALGQRGSSLVAGFNAPNRVLLTDHAVPGQHVQIAIFAANGPLSNPPANFIWVRSATLDFYKPARATIGESVETKLVRLDPGLDQLIPPDAQIEQLATGFGFCEGPVWASDEHGGALLFSDPNQNVIHRWSPADGVSIFRTKSGYAGTDIGMYRQPGSNGLAIDHEGRLTICEHGNRRITRLERNGTLTVLAERYEDKRLNSSNDLAYKSDGSLYFTDPPFGLPKVYDDPAKELPYSGVFRWRDGELTLLATDLKGPNGLAFSPDERFLYVANWDEQHKVVMRYDVLPDGTLTNGFEFFNMNSAPGEEALDGVKVDHRGNLYVSGPVGMWIISAEGTHLGTLIGPELAANMAWGDDGRSLYLAARTSLNRIRINPHSAER